MFNKDNGKYEGFIYCIFNMFNQKSYIGQTTRTIDIRVGEHKKRAKERPLDSPILYQDIKNYGFDKFDVYEVEKIVADTLSELKNELNKKEVYYISYYNSMAPNGYNITSGGHQSGDDKKVYQFDEFGNMICEYESLQDVGLKNSVNTSLILKCCKENRSMAYGCFWCFSDTLPDEYLYSKRAKTKTVMYDLCGNFVKVFDSIKDAAFEVARDKSKWQLIQQCMSKKKYYKTAYGYIWRYYDDVKDDSGNVIQKLSEYEIVEATTNKRNSFKGRCVCQFSLNGDYLQSYCTVTYAADKTGISRGSLNHCLNGRQNSAGGYIWRYYDDVESDLTETIRILSPEGDL